jgi:cell division protein FtsQ
VQLVSGIDDALLIRRREQLRAQGRRRLMVLLAVLGTLALLGGYKLLAMSSAFAVDSVHVTGAPPALERDIAAAVESQAGGHSLLNVDRGAIARQLSQMPYVRSVTVDRAFPHTLGIKVAVEHPAIVVASAGGGYLVSDDGRVLEQRTKIPAWLPLVRVPRGTSLIVGRDAGDANIAMALSVLSQAPAGFTRRVGTIHELVPNNGMVTALVGKHLHLRLGTPDHLALKLAVVQRVMHRITGAQRSELSYVDVSAPKRPAYGMRSTLPSSGT